MISMSEGLVSMVVLYVTYQALMWHRLCKGSNAYRSKNRQSLFKANLKVVQY